jgi:hypothetical protein
MHADTVGNLVLVHISVWYTDVGMIVLTVYQAHKGSGGCAPRSGRTGNPPQAGEAGDGQRAPGQGGVHARGEYDCVHVAVAVVGMLIVT